MANFNFTVDTNPMANSVSGVGTRVQETTAAVVAMQGAVIAAEAESAKRICHNVDTGFYNLIRSQVSMKLATYFTEMNAKLALLLEYAKTLARVRERMEEDFFRLRREYKPIFGSLDSALRNRVSQLDNNAIALSAVRDKVILGKFIREVPETSVISEEVTAAEQQIVIARLKSKTNRSLNFMGGKVQENNVYSELMGEMMEDVKIDKEYEELVPVVYSVEQSMLRNDSFVTSLHYPDYLPESVRNVIGLNVLDKLDSIRGEMTEAEQTEITAAFNDMLASSGIDPRVANIMAELFRKGEC